MKRIARDQTQDDYYKAQSLAYWSFIGLIIPIVGIILAAMGRSRLRELRAEDDEEQDRIEHASHIAGWGLGLSITLLVLWVVGGAFIGYRTSQQQALAAQQQQQQSAQAAQEQAAQQQIQDCENQVHQKWDPIIDNEMGLDQSLAYQQQGLEQTYLNNCQNGSGD